VEDANNRWAVDAPGGSTASHSCRRSGQPAGPKKKRPTGMQSGDGQPAGWRTSIAISPYDAAQKKTCWADRTTTSTSSYTFSPRRHKRRKLLTIGSIRVAGARTPRTSTGRRTWTWASLTAASFRSDWGLPRGNGGWRKRESQDPCPGPRKLLIFRRPVLQDSAPPVPSRRSDVVAGRGANAYYSVELVDGGLGRRNSPVPRISLIRRTRGLAKAQMRRCTRGPTEVGTLLRGCAAVSGKAYGGVSRKQRERSPGGLAGGKGQ